MQAGVYKAVDGFGLGEELYLALALGRGNAFHHARSTVTPFPEESGNRKGLLKQQEAQAQGLDE